MPSHESFSRGSFPTGLGLFPVILCVVFGAAGVWSLERGRAALVPRENLWTIGRKNIEKRAK